MWLRYATQFSTGGRTFTIEVSVPMPLGVSSERREQLLREADLNLSQLVHHVEQRVPQVIQQTLATHHPISAQPARSSTPSQPATKAAPVSPPQASPAPISSSQSVASTTRETPEQYQTASPSSESPSPTRSDVAANVQHASDLSNDNNGNLLLPQFIQYIRANLDLTPKQAMELLKVKTLSGVNLRDALEHLRYLVAQETTTGTNSPAHNDHASPPSASYSAPTSSNANKENQHQMERDNMDHPRGMREARPVRVFDEEDEEADEEEEIQRAFDDNEFEEIDLSQELTMSQRIKARSVLNKLRESRGATTANPSRLQALNNVADTQISSQQMQELISGVWGMTSLKKLKVDQVEALIAWAKEDDFVSDAEAVLMLLEEE